MRKSLYIVLMLFLTLSCSTVTNIQKAEKLDLKNKSVVVMPFENFTETPLAGLRVSSIVYGVLSSRNLSNVHIYNLPEDKDYKPEEIRGFIDSVKGKNYDFAVIGSVNEFRYKTGIDGEPAVSLTIKIYDLKNEKVVYSAVGSKTGWSHESLSTVSQKIVNKLLP